VARFDARTVFERDGWRCQLCGDDINPTLRFPHPLSATIDHILPLTKGGDHSLANVQTAHFRCNCMKGNRLLYAVGAPS
jgi:5-methylcytosine-specific restriction endonuclease McrA